MVFKIQSQVRNKSPDNCITVQTVSFVEYKLHPACQSLKSWAGRAQDWKWQKQIAAAAILRKENGHFFIRYIQGVHTVLYESLISCTQETQDTIIHSEVPPLSLQWELKSTCCQVQWHSCFPLAPVRLSHGAETNYSRLEMTHFRLQNSKPLLGKWKMGEKIYVKVWSVL